MGVINLGALVEKLKKKLSGAGFVTSTDYATASKGGVVKVGTTGGLQVSSGTLKGKTLADAAAYAAAGDDVVMTKGDMAYAGGGGGSASVDVLWNGTPADAQSASTELTLEHDVTDYNIILVTTVGNDSTLKNQMTSVLDGSSIIVGTGDDSQIIIHGCSGSGSINALAAFKFTTATKLTVSASAGTQYYFYKIVGIKF